MAEPYLSVRPYTTPVENEIAERPLKIFRALDEKCQKDCALCSDQFTPGALLWSPIERIRRSKIEASQQANKLVEIIFDSLQEELRKSLDQHGDYVASRWKKLSRTKRQNVLLEVAPDLYPRKWPEVRGLYGLDEDAQCTVDSIRPRSRLPEKYEAAVCQLRTYCECYFKVYVDMLGPVLGMHPSFSQNYTFTPAKDGSLRSTLKFNEQGRDSEGALFMNDRLHWALHQLSIPVESLSAIEKTSILIFLDDHIVQTAKKGDRKELARLDSVLQEHLALYVCFYEIFASLDAMQIPPLGHVVDRKHIPEATKHFFVRWEEEQAFELGDCLRVDLMEGELYQMQSKLVDRHCLHRRLNTVPIPPTEPLHRMSIPSL